MKKFLKILAAIVFLLIAGIAIFLTYIIKFKPNIPVEEVKIEYTPERIERGKYLAENVSRCIACHSTNDWDKFSAPPIKGTEGKGGEVFDKKDNYPGKYYAPNITPAHLKDWSDGEIFRAITAGVSKDGHPLFPAMPYPAFGKMDREDIYSIIAYIRSLPAIQNEVPASESDFPMNIIVHIIPSKPEFSAKPSPNDKVAYGKYLATAASCIECHTQLKRGQIDKEMAFGGGRYFSTRDGLVNSANITPDKETGIGAWDENTFIERFKAFDNTQQNISYDVKKGDFNTVMPWQKLSGMTRDDLSAIYAYLKTVKPISNRVTKDRYLK